MAKIENLARLQRKFAALPGAMRKSISESLVTSAEELASFQKRLAPRDTGSLEASIRTETMAEGGDVFRIEVKAGGTPATRREVRKGSGQFTDEAVLVEFGSKAHIAGGEFKGAHVPAQRARPFFYPAYRALRKRIKARASRAITKAVKEIAAQQ